MSAVLFRQQLNANKANIISLRAENTQNGAVDTKSNGPLTGNNLFLSFSLDGSNEKYRKESPRVKYISACKPNVAHGTVGTDCRDKSLKLS